VIEITERHYRASAFPYLCRWTGAAWFKAGEVAMTFKVVNIIAKRSPGS
jgi:hypothetical protein